MAPVLSTPFLLSVLLAGTSTDAFAIVRPRKAAPEIPADYGVHYTGGHGTGTSCTPSTQTVTLSSSIAAPPVITGAYPVTPTNIGYPPAPSSSTSSSSASAGYESPPFNPETSGYGAPAEPTPTLSLGYKQPEEPTNTPILPGQYGISSAWTSYNSSGIYLPTGTGRLPTGYLPETTSTSLTSDSLVPYVTTSTSVMVYPEYPSSSASSSSSVSEGYMTVQTSTVVESVISSGVVPGYGDATSSPPPGYSSSTPPAYAASSSTPPAGYVAVSSSTPPAEYAVPSSSSSSAVASSSASSVIGEIYPPVSSSAVYQQIGVYPPATPTSTPPAGYQAVTSTATPPAPAAPTTLATSVAPSSSAAGYGYIAPEGAASMIYAA